MRPELLGGLKYRRDILEALTGYFSGNWTKAHSRGIEWETLKVVIRGKNLTKTYGIRKKLYQELAQQEDTLNAMQHQTDNGDALEAETQVVHGCIGALWSRLDSYVHKDFRQRLHRAIYSSPRCDVSSQIREYLDGLRLPRLTDVQAEELEVELSLEDLHGALGGMASGKAAGPDGLPVEFYRAYSVTLLTRQLEILQEARKGGLLLQQMREALIVMLPKAGRDPADLGSYRPLSMLNVDVKLLANILAMGRIIVGLSLEEGPT
ncbi:hypothetical protein NDU88_005881 [Pleurodeles waltl]|uniref:Uncharacterized protein n=1 Tax=Pleurodeles waltl TaxID=8319 RepID=A0AAV7TC05_PLEWA|nr:hypothetical protein NDU88_005881 [Pleurodeles waltl]